MELKKRYFKLRELKKKKSEKMIISIYYGKTITLFTNESMKAETFNQMIRDGKKVLISRGQLIQLFPKETISKINEKVSKDINALKKVFKDKFEILELK